MRRFVAVASLIAACSPSPEVDSVQPASPPLTGAVDGAQGDHADHACQIVLRALARTGAQECDGAGACWRVFDGTVDVAAAALAAQDAPWVLFQAGAGPTWYQAPLVAAPGDRAGFTTFDVHVAQHGIAATAPLATARLKIIPYLWVPAGARLFDHNRVTDDAASYVLDASDKFGVAVDAAKCAAPIAPQATVRFLSGFTQERHGAVVAGGKLVVDYDIHRIPGCIGTTADGVPAWDTTAWARFAPSGATVSANVRGAQASDGSWASAPASFDVPASATGVSLWFMTGGAHCTTTYDSDFGANYNFAVAAHVAAAPSWAGDWGGSFDRACAHAGGLADPVHVTEWTLERACMFVDVDVYAAGTTDTDDVQALADWSLDGVAQSTVWLASVGRAGNNGRYRWTIDRAPLMAKTSWKTATYTLRFSTDGNSWLRAATRTLVHDDPH